MWWTTPPRRYLNGTSLTRPLGCCAVGPSCAFSLFPWKTLSLLYFTLPVSAGDITHLLPAYLQHAITIHLLIRHITVVVTVHCLFLLVNTARFLLLPSTGFHLPIQVYFALSLSLSLSLSTTDRNFSRRHLHYQLFKSLLFCRSTFSLCLYLHLHLVCWAPV